jgi:hypothetical protein
MAFPISPVNGQTTTVNGIRYIYASTTNTWSRIPSGKYTAAATGPSNPSTGDHWYNTSEDTLYEYVSDGVSSYWIDIQTGFVGGSSTGLLSNTTIAGTLTMTGNILPSANVTYDLGSSAYRFRDLWLSGNTIRLGGATISATADTLVLSNPGGGSYVLAGNAITGNTTNTYGNITVSANVITSNVYADRFFYSNGTAFSSGSSYGNTEVATYLTSNVSGLVSTTSGIQLPSGTTAQRPANPQPGVMRYNTTLTRVEAYMPGAGWSEVVGDVYSIEYLAIAGGGGGGTGGSQDSGGGGGAGGVVGATVTGVVPGTILTITVGAGAAGFTSGGQNGNPGANTTITATGYSFTTALKGGYGVGESGNRNGGSGWGSGGGAGGWSGTQGTGTAGQGYDGGAVGLSGGGSSGGGGGAGGAGTHNGGVGTSSYSAWGTATGKGQNVGGTYYFAGGGGGAGDGRNISAGGTGGSGGGGAGGWNGGTGDGVVNTGSGGGGGTGSSYGPQTSGAGGSGIVILRYLGSQRGLGGNIVTAAGYTYHTFTGSGSYTA